MTSGIPSDAGANFLTAVQQYNDSNAEKVDLSVKAKKGVKAKVSEKDLDCYTKTGQKNIAKSRDKALFTRRVLDQTVRKLQGQSMTETDDEVRQAAGNLFASIHTSSEQDKTAVEQLMMASETIGAKHLLLDDGRILTQQLFTILNNREGKTVGKDLFRYVDGTLTVHKPDGSQAVEPRAEPDDDIRAAHSKRVVMALAQHLQLPRAEQQKVATLYNKFVDDPPHSDQVQNFIDALNQEAKTNLYLAPLAKALDGINQEMINQLFFALQQLVFNSGLSERPNGNVQMLKDEAGGKAIRINMLEDGRVQFRQGVNFASREGDDERWEVRGECTMTFNPREPVNPWSMSVRYMKREIPDSKEGASLERHIDRFNHQAQEAMIR